MRRHKLEKNNNTIHTSGPGSLEVLSCENPPGWLALGADLIRQQNKIERIEWNRGSLTHTRILAAPPEGS